MERVKIKAGVKQNSFSTTNQPKISTSNHNITHERNIYYSLGVFSYHKKYTTMKISKTCQCFVLLIFTVESSWWQSLSQWWRCQWISMSQHPRTEAASWNSAIFNFVDLKFSLGELLKCLLWKWSILLFKKMYKHSIYIDWTRVLWNKNAETFYFVLSEQQSKTQRHSASSQICKIKALNPHIYELETENSLQFHL